MPPRKTDKWEAQHQRNLLAYERQIDAIYKAAVAESASIAGLCDFNPVELFSFSKYPITQERVRKLLYGLGNDLYSAIVNGVRSEWTLANRKNDELCNVVFGDMASLLTDEQRKRYYATNPKAQEAFLARKESGLNLSDRVWKYTDQFKEEIEMGIDIGLRDGLSADELSRDLRQYLQYPDKLFRRVRDEHGILQLSKAAKAFHPGQGVYRSSYKNARRLAATEANIAYRTADYERWQQLDFVVGFEVKLSNNHPVTDICDYLKGRYPKDFKYTGWHPHCRCYVVSILKTPEEMQADNELILQGGEPSEGSVNTVTDVPQGFKDWLKDNEERIEAAKKRGTLPYFLKDNDSLINRDSSSLKMRKNHKIEKEPSVIDEDTDKKYSEELMKIRGTGELAKGASLSEIDKQLTQMNIEYQPVQKMSEPLTSAQIIARISGKDHTDGSCASMALAYAANRCGWDVLDFRGGASCNYFQKHIVDVMKDAGGKIISGTDNFDMSEILLRSVQKGKEYIFTCSDHCAVVRRTDNGLEYLDLQEKSKNGWKLLTDNELEARFNAVKERDKIDEDGIIMIDKLISNSYFRSIMGRINNQRKGKRK